MTHKIMLTLLLCLLISTGSSAEENTKLSNDVFEEITKEYSLKYAAQNLEKNKEIYLKMLEKVDGASASAWKKILGDNIISQPIAALEIISLSKMNIESICPPFFGEDTPDSVINDWNQNAIDVLKSFQMTDKEDERTRQMCLKSIIEVNEAMRKID